MNKKLTSRKLWMALIPAVLIFVENLLGVELDKEYIVAQLAPFIAYILGESYVDANNKKAKAGS